MILLMAMHFYKPVNMKILIFIIVHTCQYNIVNIIENIIRWWKGGPFIVIRL